MEPEGHSLSLGCTNCTYLVKIILGDTKRSLSTPAVYLYTELTLFWVAYVLMYVVKQLYSFVTDSRVGLDNFGDHQQF